MIDVARARAEYPLLAEKTYLNSGSYCPLAKRVKLAFEAYMDERLAVGANWDQWVLKSDEVRSLVARLLRVDDDEIAVTASVTAGLNAIASALDFGGDRNKIVVTDFEFPTNAQVWHAQAPRGADVVHARPGPDGYISPEAFEDLIDDRTRLVAITHVCFRNGARLDIPAIVAMAHRKGALVLLDSYQAVGSIDIDAKALDVDFAVGGMLKYLLGTAGIGYLYVRKSLIPSLVPTVSGWWAQADIQAMDITRNNPHPTARRFEAGTPPVVNCYAAAAGLRLILELGTDAIEAHIRALTRHCMERLADIGWPSITPARDDRRAAMIAIPSRASGRLMETLLARDIVTSHRDMNLRASFHYFNDETDVDRLIAALAGLKPDFGPA